ncbi:M1 family aminopeptidase [Lacihabitans soyangensis]|uniref:Aminopeptidase N n=1 Tax=Lacihabitans soyangensis TaxID=869394 RepID=A0AAE3KTI1_9BACT|nr:M1 family aminopeptidase [Lacihabitans soyangensis]MCP9762261.1 T9SS C-terminal target domain-containing protein [Lacihabitans soyangensis]
MKERCFTKSNSMIKDFMRFYLVVLCFSIIRLPSLAQPLTGQACAIHKAAALKQKNAQSRVQYPGDINIDVGYHRIKLNINPTTRFLSASVFTRFKVLSEIKTVSFDLQANMKVDSVVTSGKKVTFSQASNKLSLTLPNTLKANDIQSLEIFYKGTPRTSAFGSFSVSTHGPAKSPVVWTLSEPYGAPDWWPCKDNPADKIDSSEVSITLPSSFVSVSNGVLISEIPAENGLKTYKWKNSHPIAHYLISIACSNYLTYESTFSYKGKTMPVVHYMYPEALTSTVKKQLDQTNDMLKFFSDLFGEYPFIDEKYGHAMCNFGGGMEHQTVSSMGGFSEDLIAHELAHQWFGDKITCKTWSDIFVNEAFASYAEALYQEHKYGKTVYFQTINDYIAAAKKTTEPVYISNPAIENLVFDYGLTYGKGAVVLHMLRGVLSDSVFFKTLKNYQNSEFAHKAATVDDFRKIAEETSKTDLKYFFDEWIYGVSYPKYTFGYTQTAPDVLKIDVSQEKLSTNPSFFKMPIEFRIVLQSGKEILHKVFQNEITQSFEIKNLQEPVKDVIFDPNALIMKELKSLGSITGNEINGKEINIFPNPASEFLELQHLLKDLKSIEILNTNGQLIKNLAPNSNIIDLRNLPSGSYILKLNTPNRIISSTFIKN